MMSDDLMISGWNFARVWEVIAQQLPDAPALLHGGLRRSWAEFDARADRVAARLLDSSFAAQEKVAQYLYNAPEYIESVFASWKAGMVPVNTNYRYVDDELVYLWGNADVVAVVFHGAFADTIGRIRARVPLVRTWLWVDDSSGECPDWAIPYEEVATTGHPPTAPPVVTGDDLYLLYTGGTTGLPKGVMWRQDDLFCLLTASAKVQFPEDGGLADVREMVATPGPVFLTGCPLMHGTGAFSAFSALSSGGCVVTLPGRRFDPVELLDAIEQHQVQSMAIVGDTFAKPILRELDAAPSRWDISSLRIITSSGVMWSSSTKAGLLRHNQRLILADSFGSSEAVGMASSVTSAGRSVGATARFTLSPNTRVITEDGRVVEPGSGEPGMVAILGRTPIGYYKDEAKSAMTFRVIDGERYSIPGDWAIVEPDGTFTLLGRGSACINTGGEKVFPEEVEEVLKEHPSVKDAAVVGVPDDRFGEAVIALVETEAQGSLDEAVLIRAVRARLAAYKAPRRILQVESLDRAANGKLDHPRWREFAAAHSGGGPRG